MTLCGLSWSKISAVRAVPLQNYTAHNSETQLTTLLDEIPYEHATLVGGKLADESFVKVERVARHNLWCKEMAMHDDELQLRAQSALQEFDDARDQTGVRLRELGLKAIDALDAFVDYWKEKPFMQHVGVEASDGSHLELREYGERQMGWAQAEKDRVGEILSAISSES